MGNWNINIQGIGCHHNGKPDIDADLAAVEFVAKLRAMGLTVESASFTSGGKVDLLEVSKATISKVLCILNGKPMEFDSIVTYEAVATMAGQGNKPSVTFKKARFGKQGILSPGQSVEAGEGTVFDAYDTSNA